MANVFAQPCDEGFIRSRPIAAPCASKAESWILAATILGSSMAFIDGTVVNVALPALQANLSATVVDVQWVVEAYALFLAALLLVGGSMGDRFGRRRIFCLGAIVFALASICCGVASDIDGLISARAVQGIGAALLVPGSLAIIGASFSEDRRASAIGIWSGSTAITTAIGPVLGGWLIERVSWRAIFFINVPVAIVVVIISVWGVPESRDEQARRGLDWFGAMLAVIGLGAVVYALIDWSHSGLGHPSALVAFVGVLSLAFFLVVEMGVDNPMLPLPLFRSRNFAGANLLTLFLYAALSGGMFFVPLNLIQVQGYSATQAGAAWLPFIFIVFALSRWSGGLVNSYGARVPLVIGSATSAVGYALFILPDVGSTYWTSFLPAIVVLGLGMGISVAPLTTTVMSAVSKEHAGVASGVNNAVSRTAGLLGIAVLGIVMLNAFSGELDRRLRSSSVTPEVRRILDQQRVKLAALELPSGITDGTRAVLTAATNECFVFGFRIVMMVAVGMALASAMIALVMIDGTPHRRRN